MCYNYEISKEKNEFALQIKDAGEQLKFELNLDKPVFRANGFAHPKLPIITMEQPDRVQKYSWGLVPFFIKGKTEADKIRIMTLNATCEGVFDKPSFKGSIMKKRCLIPATGFFEWHTIGKTKFPFFIQKKGHELFMFGGLYSNWVDKLTGELRDTYTIITTPGNKLLNEIHNTKQRMPLMFERGNELEWLNPALDKKGIEDLMKPLDEKYFEAYPVSKLITTKGVNSNVPEVKERVNYLELGELNNKWAA